MLKKLLITFLLHVNFVRCYTNSMVIPEHCIIRRTIIYDTKMPTLYTKFNFNVKCIDNNKFLTAEHVYPQSLLNEHQSKDMHNIIKTFNVFNVNRSNYIYS